MIDESRKAAMCRALAALVGLEYMWGEDGPSDEGADILEARETPLSDEESIILEMTWAIWGDDPGPSFSDLLKLENAKAKPVGELLVAMAEGPTAIDAWLKVNQHIL